MKLINFPSFHLISNQILAENKDRIVWPLDVQLGTNSPDFLTPGNVWQRLGAVWQGCWGQGSSSGWETGQNALCMGLSYGLPFWGTHVTPEKKSAREPLEDTKNSSPHRWAKGYLKCRSLHRIKSNIWVQQHLIKHTHPQRSLKLSV